MNCSIVISIGKYGGFYYHNEYTKRICLGWIAITYIPQDFDDMILDICEIQSNK